jgi:hypothetical protein
MTRGDLVQTKICDFSTPWLSRSPGLAPFSWTVESLGSRYLVDHWAATPFGGGGAAPSVALMIAALLGALCESGGGALSVSGAPAPHSRDRVGSSNLARESAK